MERIKKILGSISGIPTLNEAELEKLCKLAEILVEENRKVNVTSITDPVGIALKHFADSLSLLELDELKGENVRLADIGCGGGFPGLPVKITRPDINLTMLDSTEKKIRYVTETAKKLSLEDIFPITARAEEIASKNGALREKFDVVTARALARLNVLCELCIPFVKVGGTFVSMKAATAMEELEEARRAIGQLGGRVKYVKEVHFDLGSLDINGFSDSDKSAILDFIESKRYMIVVEKVSPTPDAYPRQYSKIIKKGL